MPSAEANTEANAKTVNRYLELLAKGQAGAIAHLDATAATVEDPVGGEVHIGRQAIYGFYFNDPDKNNYTGSVSPRALRNRDAWIWRSIPALGRGCQNFIQ